MRLTPNEVALITSGMTTLMAMATIVVTRLNARDNLRHQREQAHDERLWKERSDLYTDVIDWIRRDMLRSMMYIEDLNNPPARTMQEDLDEGRRRQARIAALGSQPVRDLLSRRLDAAMKVTSWNVEHAGQGLSVQQAPEYRELLETLWQADKDLVEQIREELRTGQAKWLPGPQRRRLRLWRARSPLSS